MFKHVTHVIFDCDGLMLDTEYVHTEVLNRFVGSFSQEMPDNVRNKVLGRTERDMSVIVTKDLNLPCESNDLLNYFNSEINEQLPNSHLMPGVYKLLLHLHNKGIPIAVATSSCKRSMMAKTSHYKPIFNLFHHIVMGGSDPEVKKSKPAPDIYLTCASRFPTNPSPKKCLVFEDAPNGVTAARIAGMQVVMVPDPKLDKKLTKNATLVLESIEHFRPELFGLPPYCNCIVKKK